MVSEHERRGRSGGTADPTSDPFPPLSCCAVLLRLHTMCRCVVLCRAVEDELQTMLPHLDLPHSDAAAPAAADPFAATAAVPVRTLPPTHTHQQPPTTTVTDAFSFLDA